MKKFLTLLTSLGISCASLLRAEPPKQLVLILLGPPGAGKGTHAVELTKTLILPHISTGDLFRENISQETSLGKKAKSFMDQGHLVPDEIVLDMLLDRIAKKDCEKGYILDGFPRTLEQAKTLDKTLNKKTKLIVINLDIEDKYLIERITGRLVCKNCGATYHKKHLPPQKEGLCNECQGELYQRKDDTTEVVKERLKVYHSQTKPLIAYYQKKENVFYQIDATAPKEEIFQNIVKTINQAKKNNKK